MPGESFDDKIENLTNKSFKNNFYSKAMNRTFDDIMDKMNESFETDISAFVKKLVSGHKFVCAKTLSIYNINYDSDNELPEEDIKPKKQQIQIYTMIANIPPNDPFNDSSDNESEESSGNKSDRSDESDKSFKSFKSYDSSDSDESDDDW